MPTGKTLIKDILSFRILFSAGVGLLYLAASVAIFTNLDEDAFISFRYVDQLYAGNGLVFNIGERVEGYSNFLWIILLLPFKVLGLPLANTARILGMLFATGTGIVGMCSIKRLIPEDSQFPWLFALWYVLSIPVIFWSQSGLETSLISFIIMCFIYCQTSPKNGWFFSGSWAVLGSLTRPEAHMLIGLYFMILFFRYQKRECIRGIIVVSSFLLSYHLLRIIYFGEIFATPALIKVTGDFNRGMDYLMSFFVDGQNLWGVPLFVYAIVNNGVRKRVLVPAGVVILYIFFNLYSGGDYKNHFRFIVPFMAPFMVVSLAGAGQIKTLFPFKPGKRIIHYIMVLLIMVSLVCYHSPYGDKRYSFEIFLDGFSNWGSRFAGQLEHHAENYDMCYNVFLGEWIRDNFSPNISFAYEQMGQVPYYAGTAYYFIDLIGLTNLYIAHCYDRLPQSSVSHFIRGVFQKIPFFDTGRITEKVNTMFYQGDPSATQDIVRYVLQRRPEVVMVVAFIANRHPWVDLINSHSFRDNYQLAQVFGYRQGMVWQGKNFEENNTLIFFRKDHCSKFLALPPYSFKELSHDWFKHYTEAEEVHKWVKRNNPALLPLLGISSHEPA